jgi:thymidylate synthase ThyX
MSIDAKIKAQKALISKTKAQLRRQEKRLKELQEKSSAELRQLIVDAIRAQDAQTNLPPPLKTHRMLTH